MRKITAYMGWAINNHTNWTNSNTSVIVVDDTANVFLHGNLIFTYSYKSKTFTADNCGWNTQTTRERINGCLCAIGSPFIVRCRKGEYIITQYIDNAEKVISTSNILKGHCNRKGEWVAC